MLPCASRSLHLIRANGKKGKRKKKAWIHRRPSFPHHRLCREGMKRGKRKGSYVLFTSTENMSSGITKEKKREGKREARAASRNTTPNTCIPDLLGLRGGEKKKKRIEADGEAATRPRWPKAERTEVGERKERGRGENNGEAIIAESLDDPVRRSREEGGEGRQER